MNALASPAPAPTVEEIISHLQKQVSASRLTLFLQCRLKFFFRYVAGLTKPKTAALHVGGTVHSVLKAWNKARWKSQSLTLKELHDEFSKAWTDAGDEPVQWEPGEEDDEKQTAWRLVETYIRESNILANVKPDAVEVPVDADLHAHGLPTLVGVLDMVQSGQSRLTLTPFVILDKRCPHHFGTCSPAVLHCVNPRITHEKTHCPHRFHPLPPCRAVVPGGAEAEPELGHERRRALGAT